VLPTFIIIGAQKAATTSLWAYLREHPGIFLPDLKEPNFFLREGNWDRGRDWYEALFAPAGERKVRGEASTGYAMWPVFAGVPRRMASIIPDVKLIYLVRDPIDRMVSSWQHAVADHADRKPLEQSLLGDIPYLATSHYASQIERYLECFDRSQLLVLKTDDLELSPDATLSRVCRFVGADEGWAWRDPRVRHNSSDTKVLPRAQVRRMLSVLDDLGSERVASAVKHSRSRILYRPFRPTECQVSADVREKLVEYLRPEMQRLAALCGPDFELWEEFAGSNHSAPGAGPAGPKPRQPAPAGWPRPRQEEAPGMDAEATAHSGADAGGLSGRAVPG
jgi:hypothetical protein